MKKPKEDHGRAVSTLIKAHRRFISGIYCRWYPLVDRQRIERMERSVIKSGMRRIQRYELGRENREKRGGMQAIGLILILINPSWILFAKMERLLPLFAERLGNGEKYQYQCETMVGE